MSKKIGHLLKHFTSNLCVAFLYAENEKLIITLIFFYLDLSVNNQRKVLLKHFEVNVVTVTTFENI